MELGGQMGTFKNLVKSPRISFLPSAQDRPEDKYLHEVNREDFEGTSYLVHGGSNSPSKMPNPRGTNPIGSGSIWMSCPMPV